MKLLNKTLAIILLTLAGMLLLMYMTSQVIFVSSYASVEKSQVKGQLDSAISTVNYDLAMLDTVTVDYAYWDDTYEIVNDPNITDETPYVVSNFIETTYEMQRLNLIALLSANGSLAYSRAYDRDNRTFVDVPAGFGDAVKPGSPLMRSGSDDSVHGILMLNGKAMMVSAYPVKNSDGDAPTRGTLIMGRYLGADEIQGLGNITNLQLEVVPYSGTVIPDDYLQARSSLKGSGSYAVIPLSEARVAGYTTIYDIYGNPALILRVDEPRSAYIQGQNSILYLFLCLLLSGIAFGILSIFLLEKMVLSPIAKLGKTVHYIGEKDDPSMRVEVRGDDEVAMLARTINKTLATLQTSREKLFANEQKFRSLVENTGDLVVEMNDRFEYTYISPNVKTILGYEPEEVLGKRISDFAVPEDGRRLKSMSAGLLIDGQPIPMMNIEVLDRQGQPVDLEFIGTRTYDPHGRVTGMHGVARDVRERRRVERILQKWADIFHLAMIPITITGHEDLKLDMVNPAFFQLYGYGAGDLDNMHFEEIFDPKYRSDLAEHVRRADADGHNVFESRHLHKDGTSFPVIVDISAVKDSEGNVLYRVINVQDITELKHAEKALYEAYDELMASNKALHAENVERRKIEQQIMASLQEKEVLLKEIHHRVKNNLQIISSLLNLQSGNVSQENAIVFKESQNRIKSMALIHEKLYQSRDLSHIDFGEYAGSLTAYLARSYISNPGVKITVDIRDISLDIDTAIPCGLIINELVSNSLKYAFKDGKPGEIRVGLRNEEGRYTLVVGDDGTGLPQELDFRDSPSLGLQLVNTLVEQIEGTIELDRTAGTVFTIKFREVGV